MSTQGDNGDPIQKFFRVYIPNVTEDDMKLPFVSDKISGTPLPRKVTVKSVSSGKIWRMEMTTNGVSSTVFLRDGWKKIAKDENPKEPIFLVFEFDGSRVFHFCVYEHGSMRKRMRSPMEKEVIEVESEEADNNNDDGDSDGDGDGDGDGDDDDVGDDVIVEDEESTRALDESPRRKEVIEVESEEESDDDYDDDDDDDDDVLIVEDEESTKGLDESPRRKKRGGTSRMGAYLKTDSHMFDEYLDNKLNPNFLVHITQNRTRIPSSLIKDYNLTFPNLVIVRDKIGILKRRISVWKNRAVFINGMGSIIRRNDVKQGDKMLCELKMVDGYHGLVQEIKVHIIKA